VQFYKEKGVMIKIKETKVLGVMSFCIFGVGGFIVMDFVSRTNQVLV